MRLLVLFLMLTLSLCSQMPARGLQSDNSYYRNNSLGVGFQYPAEWKIREQPATQTVILSSPADLDSVSSGKAPSGLLFSLTMSSFRQIGVENIENFAPVLQKISGASQTHSTHMAGVDGLVAVTSDTVQDIATQTAILSVGKRRIAVLRGVSTISVWEKTASQQFDDLVKTLSFFPPDTGADADSIGSVLWQLPADGYTDLTDLALNATSSTLYAVSRSQGIWKVGANGVPQDLNKPTDIDTFGGIGVLRDGTQYIADPGTHSIWIIGADNGKPRRFLGGQTGNGRGAFGAPSPAGFAFGLEGAIYALDENDKGLRVQVFNRAGSPIAAWDLSKLQTAPIEAPSISSDRDGNAYVVGRNTSGVIKLSAGGQILVKDLGKNALENSGPLAIAVDRFGNIFVATEQQGIVKLNPSGNLIGVIGQAYDEAAAPKPGQFGKPIALVLSADSSLLYVLDAGKYPQIVAIALEGESAVNLDAGTKSGGDLTYGQSVTGEITNATFVYTYTFSGKTGDVVTITLQHDDKSKLDTYLDLIGPDKQRVAANDDAKVTGLDVTDSQIKDFKLPHNGVYTIRATRFGRETTTGTGSFILHLDATTK